MKIPAASILCGFVLLVAHQRASAQAATPRIAADEVIIDSIERNVQVLRAGSAQWQQAVKGQVIKPGDRIRTLEFSQVTLLWSEKSVTRLAELSDVQIQAPPAANQPTSFSLLQGVLYFFNRDRLANARYRTRTASAAIRGTEFVLQVAQNGVTTLTVIEGEVDLSNEIDALTLRTGEQGIAEPGQAPRKLPAIIVNNVIQWALYYPAVLDANELGFTLADRGRLGQSLAAYQSGDLLRALELLPAQGPPPSASERIYRASLLLAVGSVDQGQQILDTIGQTAGAVDAPARGLRLADAVRQLIAAVKLQHWKPATPELASEWLAQSYSHQARADLDRAIIAARKSVETSADFGFGWARVAELEFSFGHTSRALEALDRALKYSPRNAQALALKGFALAAQNRISSAIYAFNQSMEIDPGLANARLGRGLCLIRQNHPERGREELLIAATLEPQRAILRSYLAKAYTDAGDEERAGHEIQLAKDLDPNDPTAWLYSALLKAQENRINEGIRDLQKSQELNDNRQVYRSKFLLDQDRAVRSVNLARLYADADLTDVAVREAGRAVTLDYADYSAHVFLANSYEMQRRAGLSNLRFETAAVSEYLLANMLGPANGRLLAQPVTQLEYTSLFERNRLGVIANTEYFSRGAWHHSGAQYGTFNGSSYSLESEYRSEPGERVNQDLEIQQLEAKFKHDFTPEDSMYLHILDYRAEGGDPRQLFDQSEVSRTFRFEGRQNPTVLAGYRHRWSPRHHTLILGGRFQDTLETRDPGSAVLALDQTGGTVNGLVDVFARNDFSSEVEMYSAEVQQIAMLKNHSLIAGVRLQGSEQEVSSRVSNPGGDFHFTLGLNNPVSIQHLSVDTFAASLYAYDYFTIAETFRAIAGLSFTYQDVPVNTDTAPLTSERNRQERLSPKLGFIWSPASWADLRASYTRSLTGAGLGQSIRLEPAHMAGLLQSFRNGAPPSIVGNLHGVHLETAEVVSEARFLNTFLSLGWQRLAVDHSRRVGVFLTHPDDYDLGPSNGLLSESIDFVEHAIEFSAHQLVAAEWSFGARYRFSYAKMSRRYSEYDESLFFGGLDGRSRSQAWLHTVELSALYRHRSGVFGQVLGNWFLQDRHNDGAGLPQDEFWLLNLVAGYRFPKQRAEIAVGILNLLDEDYRLDPLNLHVDHPRSRTFYARVLLNF